MAATAKVDFYTVVALDVVILFWFGAAAALGIVGGGPFTHVALVSTIIGYTVTPVSLVAFMAFMVAAITLRGWFTAPWLVLLSAMLCDFMWTGLRTLLEVPPLPKPDPLLWAVWPAMIAVSLLVVRKRVEVRRKALPLVAALALATVASWFAPWTLTVPLEAASFLVVLALLPSRSSSRSGTAPPSPRSSSS